MSEPKSATLPVNSQVQKYGVNFEKAQSATYGNNQNLNDSSHSRLKSTISGNS